MVFDLNPPRRLTRRPIDLWRSATVPPTPRLNGNAPTAGVEPSPPGAHPHRDETTPLPQHQRNAGADGP